MLIASEGGGEGERHGKRELISLVAALAAINASSETDGSSSGIEIWMYVLKGP